MNLIRVAIVGCGRISDLHQMGYRGREDARIVAVCDSNKARARKQANAWGVERIYTDYHQLLEDKKIDLVELLTPHHLHCAMAVEACRAGNTFQCRNQWRFPQRKRTIVSSTKTMSGQPHSLPL